MAEARVPWSEVQDLMKVVPEFYQLILNYQGLVEKNHMPANVAETLCANPI